MPPDKPLPHSLEAEQAVLGALLLAEKIPGDFTLSFTDFYNTAHAEIYRAMCALNDDVGRYDVITLAERLKSSGTTEKTGGVAYLSELSDATGTAQGLNHHAAIIREKADLRRIVERSRRVEALALAGDATVEAVRESATDILAEIERPELGSRITLGDLLRTEFKHRVPVIGKGIMPAGAGVMIAGESGAGKSMIRDEMAIHLALGKDVYGLPVPKPHSVFIIQFENTLQTEKERLERMIRGLNLHGAPKNISFSEPTMRFDFKLKGDRKRALKIVKESGADVIIWDPLSSIHSLPENDNVLIRHEVLDTITWINRETESASIIIHHFGKPNPDLSNSHRTRGGSSIKDWCDTLIGLVPKSNNERILRLLEFYKVRNGPQHKTILLERDNNFLHHVTDLDVLCSPQRVHEILTGMGGAVGKQKDLLGAIKAAVNCGDRTARDAIYGALEQDLIYETANGGRGKGYKAKCLEP